ncbi:MAG: CapA family protein [Mollicutes bacterium]|nr:CapA family protein [Mollicutes bacterium]
MLIFLLVGCANKELKIENKIEFKEGKEEKIEFKEKKEYKLSLIMAGDALIHDAVYKDAYIGDNEYDFSDMFEEIRPIIQNYDLAFYNQETIIGGKNLGLSTYPRFNSPEEIGDALIDVGFNIVSLANNHSLDKGEQGIIHSNQYWRTKDVMVSGTFDSFEDRNKINIQSKNNISYTLLSYTTSTNGIPVPEGKEYLVNVYNDELVKEDIERVRDEADVIIVSMHWGVEYTHTPTSEQRRIANYLAELGADIVVGHHPHVIEPIEFIDDTLVIYSLGNFISAQIGLPKLVGMLVSVDIIKRDINDSIEIDIENVQSELIYTSYSNFRNFKVIPYSKLTDIIFPNFEEKLQPYIEVIKKEEETIKVNSGI